ncbi:lipase 3-like [Hyposmocoma kahamanoa]|uniref:lipase 3-like n=1 Tax=Hyposmocoma kahamanoa TaxID=1477025 RepID=UPI000E6D9C88|nr:lipase 3-like [Hyposmocoma kahamanoa]
MRVVVVLCALLAVALAGPSPNADVIESLLRDKAWASKFSTNVIADALLDVPGLVQRYNYPVEVHNVQTSDGYILTIHRIPHGRDRNNEPGPRPVVLLMHGMLSSSADYLVLGPGNSLGYLLAEQGYDVWLGNARGNFYSRRHVSLDPDSKTDNDFWKFSWEEIGLYDVSAYVDYILDITGQEKLHYVGHSQGGTAFLVLNSLRPEYNEKFISFQGLAPAAFFYNNEHSIFNLLAPYEKLIETTMFRIGFAEIFRRHPLLTALGLAGCHEASPFHPICASVATNTFGNINATKLPILLGHSPAGSSIRQLAHYSQTIRRNVFARFYHDPITNYLKYGSFTPPPFDMSRVTVPAYIHYGLADRETNFRDLYILADRLSNAIGLFGAERETFTHYDFVWGSDAKTEIFDRLFELMRAAEQNDSTFGKMVDNIVN